MTIHKALHLRDEIDRLYDSKNEGERRDGCIKNYVEASIWAFEKYIKKSQERIGMATSNSTDYRMTNRTTITRKNNQEEKQLYGYFKLHTGEIFQKKIWTWQQKEKL